MVIGKIILASSSPRRAQILQQVGFEFEVYPSHVEEISAFETPIEMAMELAEKKAKEVAGHFPGKVILGADTVVYLDGKIFGKPEHAQEAFVMLNFLSGRKHTVVTGISWVCDEKVVTEYESTEVTFRNLQNEEIERYIATGSPMDKAGAYGIQDASAIFVEKIDGDFYNVVGLPIAKVYSIYMNKFRT